MKLGFEIQKILNSCPKRPEFIGREHNVKDVFLWNIEKIYYKPCIYFLIFVNIFLASWLLFFIYQSLCSIHALNLSASTQLSHMYNHPDFNLLLSFSLAPRPIPFCLPSIILPNTHI